MSLQRICCCNDTCTSPTGTRTITSTFEAVAAYQPHPTLWLETFDYSQEIELNCSGTAVLDTSTARVKTRRTAAIGGQIDTVREIDMTITVDGTLDCYAGSSHTCGDCGAGEFPGGVYTYGPRLRTPWKVGSTQNLSITINSYTNTSFGTPTGGYLGFYFLNTSFTPPGSSARAYAYNGTTISQPALSPPADWEPLRVWRSSKTGGQPTDVCLPEWTIWNTAVGTNSTPSCTPLCPSDKTALESSGWVFSTYTRTATMV